MLRIEMDRAGRYCDGVSRRSFVQTGLAAISSLSLPGLLQAREASIAAGGPRKDTSVILIWLDGGPSHMDMFDMKPDAPEEYRGIWSPIATNVPGVQITELMPKLAKSADKYCLLRSLHHDNGDHFAAGHVMLTSYFGATGVNTAGHNPSLGSVTAKVCGPRKIGMPPYVAIPTASSIGLRPGYFAANYLGVEFNPFETEGDPNSDKFTVNNMQLAPGLSVNRLDDRRELLSHFDRMRRDVDKSGLGEAMDRFGQTAYGMVTGTAAREAFDLTREDAATREAYGRNTWGQSTLLARRMVEAGSTFISVHMGGWDHHWDLKKALEAHLFKVDAAVSSLVNDLSTRGLLEKTLVVMCGEFGRTPRMNNGGNGGPAGSRGTPGRDHWGNSMSCFLAGGGVRGGQVVGATNRRGEMPADRPCTPADLHASIYHVLGIDPKIAFLNHSGRPTAAVDKGQVIEELF